MTMRLAAWLDSRLRLARFARKSLNHIFPDHWSFMLGEIALYSFIILVVTGTFLAMFFNASTAKVVYGGPYEALRGVSMSAAYRSVMDLSFKVPAGLFIRQTHHWAAMIFVGAIMVHILRIFFTGAFHRPREVNWVIGMTLLMLAMGNGFTGYSIPDDLLSGTGLRIGYSIALSVPVIGPWLAFLAFGGLVPTGVMISRLYGLHIFVIPALIAILIALHLSIIWRQTHTNYPGPERSNRTIVGTKLWPVYSAKAIGLFFMVFAAVAALGGLVQINPIWIYGPYDPAAALTGAQPDWYLGWMEGALRLFPGLNLRIFGYLVPDPFFPGVLLPLLVFAALYLYPFLEQRITGNREERNILQHPSEHPFRTSLGFTVLSFLLVLFFGGGQDVISVITGAHLTTVRFILQVLALAVPPATALIAYLICRVMLKMGGHEGPARNNLA